MHAILSGKKVFQIGSSVNKLNKMRIQYYKVLFVLLVAIGLPSFATEKSEINPFLTDLNVPIEYGKLKAEDVEAYAKYVTNNAIEVIAAIRNQKTETFDNLFATVEELNTKISVAYSNCHMMYWVSPD